MSTNRIHIAKVTVRLPRSASRLTGDPKNHASGIGREIVKHISGATQGHAGTVRIDRLSLGTIGMDGDAGELHTRVGKQVALRVMNMLDGDER